MVGGRFETNDPGTKTALTVTGRLLTAVTGIGASGGGVLLGLGGGADGDLILRNCILMGWRLLGQLDSGSGFGLGGLLGVVNGLNAHGYTSED